MNLKDFYSQVVENRGASFSLFSGEINPNFGYFVSTAENEFKVHLSEFNEKDVLGFVLKNSESLSLENNWLGGWIENDYFYLDVSNHILDRDLALNLGIERNQKAIFNANEGKDIDLNNRTFDELTNDELAELRSNYFHRHLTDDELQENDWSYESEYDIPDEEILNFYSTTYFVVEDFFCNLK